MNSLPTIDELPLKYPECISTYHEVSKGENGSLINDINGKVIDFDRVAGIFNKFVKKQYLGKSFSNNNLSSSDMLAVNREKNKYTLIEFKSGAVKNVEKAKFLKKMLHSSIIISEIERKSFFEIDIEFILVYKASKNEIPDQDKKNPQKEELNKMKSSFRKKADKSSRISSKNDMRFLSKLDTNPNFIVKDISTYTEQEFFTIIDKYVYN